MKIGIDARLIQETGVGRYIRNLIEQLEDLDTENQYIVYLSKTSFASFILPNRRWEKRLADVRWHTFWEQIAMPILFLQDHLDLLHVPYFTIPVLYPGKFVVTIHDLTILHFATGKATTLPYGFYMLRKLGFWFILSCGLKRARAILSPSQTTKREIVEHFHIPKEKIQVTYEGVDGELREQKTESRGHETMSNEQKTESNKQKLVTGQYFLYVGNVYPHKNSEMLISAFKDFIHTQGKGNFRLIFVGKEDYFYTRLKNEIAEKGLHSSILFLGQVDDETLHDLYLHAEALVFPSLMEGFGLPALEALSLGTPVICSDIPIFHEILNDFPYYINPHDRKDITKSFSRVIQKKKSEIKEKRNEIASLLKNYSWKKLGVDTLQLYNSLRVSSPSI